MPCVSKKRKDIVIDSFLKQVVGEFVKALWDKEVVGGLGPLVGFFGAMGSCEGELHSFSSFERLSPAWTVYGNKAARDFNMTVFDAAHHRDRRSMHNNTELLCVDGNMSHRSRFNFEMEMALMQVEFHVLGVIPVQG